MTIFNLENFPNVCRACLQSLHPDQMVSLDTHLPLFDGDTNTFLQNITFQVPEMITAYLPPSVCYACLEMMEYFFKYRRRMLHLHEFLVALVRVKLGDDLELKELFHSRSDQLDMLFEELDLCNTRNARVEDLLDEYDQYMIASMPFEEHALQANETIEKQPPQVSVCAETDALFSEGSPEVICEEEINDQFTEQSRELIFKEESIDLSSSEECLEIVACEEETIAQADEPYSRSEKKRKQCPVESFKIEIEYDHNHSNFDCSEEQNSNNLKYSDGKEWQKPPYSDRKPKFQRKVKLLCCERCKYKTYYTVAYELHCMKHQENEGKTGYVCPLPYCMKLFNTKEQLKRHRVKNTPHRYICEICGSELKYRQSLDVHMERHAGITQFQCTYCSSSFYTMAEINAHVATMHNSEDRAECELCGALFTSNKLLNQHRDSHSTERNHRCSECAASFKTQTHLNRHIKTVHDAVRFKCEHCPVSYGRRDKLRMHAQKVHQIQAHFVCDICVRSFDKDAALQEHLFRHANPQELECGTCLMVCRSSESFEKHTCITYQDNYVCCDRDFKNHMRYNRHMISHGIKINARVRPKTILPDDRKYHSQDGSTVCHIYTTTQKPLNKDINPENSLCELEQRLLAEESIEEHICETFLNGNDM